MNDLNNKIQDQLEVTIPLEVAQAALAAMNKVFLDWDVLNDELLWCEVLITPPSVNHYWIRGANKTNRLSKRAIHFIDVMKRFIEPAGYQGRVRVKIEYAPPDAKIRDIDNIVKPCFDALSKGGLILDDSQVDELLVKRLPSEKGGKLIIQVEKLRV